VDILLLTYLVTYLLLYFYTHWTAPRLGLADLLSVFLMFIDFTFFLNFIRSPSTRQTVLVTWLSLCLFVFVCLLCFIWAVFLKLTVR